MQYNIWNKMEIDEIEKIRSSFEEYNFVSTMSNQGNASRMFHVPLF